MEPKIAQKLIDFFSTFTSREYKKGEVLISASESPEGIFFLEKGLVRQYAISKRGNEMTLNIYKPLSFFPMGWMLNNTLADYYFEAMTDKVVVRLAPKGKVNIFLRTQPGILLDLLSRVYKGVEGMLFHMQALQSGSAYTKLISILLISAKRFGLADLEGTKIEFRLTEKDLAVYAGIQRETVSRLLQKLFRKNLLTKKEDFLVVTHIGKLEEELQNR